MVYYSYGGGGGITGGTAENDAGIQQRICENDE